MTSFPEDFKNYWEINWLRELLVIKWWDESNNCSFIKPARMKWITLRSNEAVGLINITTVGYFLITFSSRVAWLVSMKDNRVPHITNNNNNNSNNNKRVVSNWSWTYFPLSPYRVQGHIVATSQISTQIHIRTVEFHARPADQQIIEILTNMKWQLYS